MIIPKNMEQKFIIGNTIKILTEMKPIMDMSIFLVLSISMN